MQVHILRLVVEESQMIPKDHRDFKVYGEYPPTEKEAVKIKKVKEMYGHDITPSNSRGSGGAWTRLRQAEGDANPEFEGDPFRIQEQPWDEDEAWQVTGSRILPAGEAN